MPRTLPVLLLATLVAEIASIIWVGGQIGIVPTLMLMFLGGFAGVRLLKSAGMTIAEAFRSPVQTRTSFKTQGGAAAARAASGLLLMCPGFFSDLLALMLFLPPVRSWLGARFRVEGAVSGAARERRFDRVIEAEAVEIVAEVEPPRSRES